MFSGPTVYQLSCRSFEEEEDDDDDEIAVCRFPYLTLTDRSSDIGILYG